MKAHFLSEAVQGQDVALQMLEHTDFLSAAAILFPDLITPSAVMSNYIACKQGIFTVKKAE